VSMAEMRQNGVGDGNGGDLGIVGRWKRKFSRRPGSAKPKSLDAGLSFAVDGRGWDRSGEDVNGSG
jgi:hypothetical protein